MRAIGTARRLISGLAVAMLVVALAGCGQFIPEVEDMGRVRAQPGLTEAKARAKIEEYLTATLGHLPEQVSLSRQHPIFSHALLASGTIPCVDDDTVKDPPYNYDATYWVVGVPEGEAQRYQDLVVEAWRSLGWRTGRHASDTMAAKTPDGYFLDASINPRGDLSLGGSSPCFPSATVERGSMPLTIPHPRPGGP